MLQREDLTGCRTTCQTLWSLYWAGGDTGELRMSAPGLVFPPQLPSVTASCLNRTIFVSWWNYHHLVIFTMLTVSALQKGQQACDCCHVPILFPVDLMRKSGAGEKFFLTENVFLYLAGEVLYQQLEESFPCHYLQHISTLMANFLSNQFYFEYNTFDCSLGAMRQKEMFSQ